MSLFVVEGKGKVGEVIKSDNKMIVEVPKDWGCTHVRIYKLREIKIPK